MNAQWYRHQSVSHGQLLPVGPRPDPRMRQRILDALRHTVPRQFQPDWAELEHNELAEFWDGHLGPGSAPPRGAPFFPREYFTFDVLLLQYDPHVDTAEANSERPYVAVMWTTDRWGRWAHRRDSDVIVDHAEHFNSIIRPFSPWRASSSYTYEFPESGPLGAAAEPLPDGDGDPGMRALSQHNISRINWIYHHEV